MPLNFRAWSKTLAEREPATAAFEINRTQRAFAHRHTGAEDTE
jgi:hypothetical protein